jgi:hypothetical protein
MTSALQSIMNNIPDSATSKELTEAKALETAITGMLEESQQAHAIDPATIRTASDVKKAVDAAVAHDLGNEARVGYLKSLVPVAAQRVEAAQQQIAGNHVEMFRKEFDAAATRLYSILTEHPQLDADMVGAGAWNFDPALAPLRDTLAELGRLGTVRDNYVHRAGSGGIADPPMSKPYEMNSRVAYFDDYAASQRFQSNTGSIARHSPKWYVIATKTPGMRLMWQSLAEQRAQPAPAKVSKSRAAIMSNR